MSSLLRFAFVSSLSTLILLPGCKPPSEEDEGTDDVGDTLYDRLGGYEGIHGVVTNAVLMRIAADPKINAYFLNSSVDVGVVIVCLTDQLSNLTGGPEEYPNANCRDMQSSHEGLGISDADFNDLAGHFEDELVASGVAQEDIATILSALGGMHDDIVEDPDGSMSVYQRVGRYPAIATVVTDFVNLVVADPTLMAFFAATDRDRLEGCLTRQICGIDGPCQYGFEVPSIETKYEAGVCRSMLDSHEGLTITIEDFDALVGHLLTAMAEAGVTQADQDAIAGELAPLCAEIVTDPASCP